MTRGRRAPSRRFSTRRATRVDAALERWLPQPPACPPIVTEAMRYSVFAGGKRLRPVLTLAAADAVARRADTATARGRRARPTLGAARRVRDRADSHLLAHPRRPAGDGQRHAAPRPADAARRLRRRHRDPRRRRPAGRGVRAARARAGDDDPAIVGAEAARRRGRRRGGGRGRHGRRTGDRSAGGRPGAGPRRDARRRGPARDARAQDRRAHPRVGGQRRDHGGRRPTISSPRSIGTPPTSASRFRSSTTSSTSKAIAASLGKTAGKDAAGAKPTYPALFGLERSRALAAECLAARARSARRRRAGRRLAGRDRGLGCDSPELRRESTRGRIRGLVTAHRLRQSSVTWCPLCRSEWQTQDAAGRRAGRARLAPSRERARALILAGQVKVDGQVVSKAGAPVAADARRRARRRRIIRTSAAAASSSRTRSTPSRSIRRGAARSTSAPRPAASPTCCCGAARPASSRSTSAAASSTGGCAPTRASSCAKASTRAR